MACLQIIDRDNLAWLATAKVVECGDDVNPLAPVISTLLPLSDRSRTPSSATMVATSAATIGFGDIDWLRIFMRCLLGTSQLDNRIPMATASMVIYVTRLWNVSCRDSLIGFDKN
jgi:hypothetical protein